ncbi:MAG: hypothetical protein MZV64_72995 [Ignavibacteriales bacterium]|nr:hypothetical protein [Ignavibacteriales bacterium]
MQRVACRRCIEARRIRTSFIQRLPWRRPALPALPAAVPRGGRAARPRRLRPGHQHQPLRGEGRRAAPAGARHLCYCLTPMRYAWDQFDEYFGAARTGSGRRSRSAARSLALAARGGTPRTADRADRFVAISRVRGAPASRDTMPGARTWCTLR